MTYIGSKPDLLHTYLGIAPLDPFSINLLWTALTAVQKCTLHMWGRGKECCQASNHLSIHVHSWDGMSDYVSFSWSICSFRSGEWRQIIGKWSHVCSAYDCNPAVAATTPKIYRQLRPIRDRDLPKATEITFDTVRFGSWIFLFQYK